MDTTAKYNKIEDLEFGKRHYKIKSDIASKHLFKIFEQYKLSRFIFVEPGGNYGDFLIYKGAYKIAKFANLQYKSVSYNEFINSNYSNDTVIYIHGSGGYVPWWSGRPIEIFRKALHTHQGIVILGPTTFATSSEFLKNTIVADLKAKRAQKVFLFTREHISYKALRKYVASKVELNCDHDTAFNLCAIDLVPSKISGRFIFYALREDKEAIDIPKSDLLAVWLDPIKHCYNFNHWVAFHSQAKKIITNRLHSAIIGTILEIPTVIMPNNYHKNRSVWEYSLSQRGVEWLNNVPLRSSTRISNFSYPLKKISTTAMFQAALRVLYRIRYRDLCSN